MFLFPGSIESDKDWTNCGLELLSSKRAMRWRFRYLYFAVRSCSAMCFGQLRCPSRQPQDTSHLASRSDVGKSTTKRMPKDWDSGYIQAALFNDAAFCFLRLFTDLRDKQCSFTLIDPIANGNVAWS